MVPEKERGSSKELQKRSIKRVFRLLARPGPGPGPPVHEGCNQTNPKPKMSFSH
jgi:hypothetical protein